jgi:hypothetical protein
MEKERHKLVWSCVASLVLLVLFGWMQASKSPAMELKAQWLWIAVLPILIVLITGKYIGKFKGPGIEFEQYKTDPQMLLLPYAAPPGPSESLETHRSVEKEASTSLSNTSWTAERNSKYELTDRLFLAHVYEPSTRPNQKYDITVFLIRHRQGPAPNQREGFSEVEKLELYFGPSWNDAIFTALNNGGLIGVRTSAWGTFLATGRVIFKDGRPPLILHRYVDFEMAPKRT